MGQPIAKAGDRVLAVDVHVVMVPTPGGPVPVPLPHPFAGALDANLASSVRVSGQAVATLDSTATNSPSHLPTPPGTSFQSPPKDQGKVVRASGTVKVCGKAVARVGDMVETCNDPSDLPVGVIVGGGNVLVGG